MANTWRRLPAKARQQLSDELSPRHWRSQGADTPQGVDPLISQGADSPQDADATQFPFYRKSWECIFANFRICRKSNNIINIIKSKKSRFFFYYSPEEEEAFFKTT
jgi:hypothetical protein